MKKLQTVQIKILKLFCYECHNFFPNVQSFKCHRHGFKEEVEEEEESIVHLTSTTKTTTTTTTNNKTLLSTVKNQLLWTSNTLHSMKTVNKENTKSSVVKESERTNMNLKPSMSKPLEENKNPTKTIYIVSKSNPNGNGDNNIDSIKQKLPGTVLSSISINLKDLKDYFRCYKCNSSFYKLEDLVLHFRNCKAKIHEFKNLKSLKQDKTTQTTQEENDKENAIPIPMEVDEMIDNFDDPPSPSPLPPPSSDEKVNNHHFSVNTQQPSTSALQQPHIEIPERPFEFVTYNGKPTLKYLEVVRTGTTEEGSFKCRICHQVFTRNQLLYDHLVEHQQPSRRPRRLTKCSACDFRGYTKLAVEEHKLKNHPDLHVGFHCNRRMCEHRSFPNKELLMKHQQEVHPTFKGPYICHLCGVTLKSSYGFQTHLLRHEDGTQFKCKYPNCDKTYKTSKGCKDHELTHEQNRFKCTEEGCDKSFRKPSLLRDHKNEVHLGITPYKCSYPNCEETFGSIVKRLKHSYVHREATFKCQFVGCNAAFKKRKSLKLHSLRHEGNSAKKFLCTYPDCSYRSNTTTKLRGHIEGIHQQIKRFLCTTCGYAAYTSSSYKNHLLSHSEIKPFLCDSCPLAFKAQSMLKKHQISHTDERTLPCEFCDKLFKQKITLQRHLLVHTNFRPYRCVFCAAEYQDNRALKKHVARDHEGEYEFDLNVPATYQVYVKPSNH